MSSLLPRMVSVGNGWPSFVVRPGLVIRGFGAQGRRLITLSPSWHGPFHRDGPAPFTVGPAPFTVGPAPFTVGPDPFTVMARLVRAIRHPPGLDQMAPHAPRQNRFPRAQILYQDPRPKMHFSSRLHGYLNPAHARNVNNRSQKST
jgi:hypothetical protein